MEFNIEKATLNDLPYIQKLTKNLFEYEIENGFDNNINPEWSYSEEGKEELTERIFSEDSVGFVCKVNNEIVGYLIGLILEEETGRVDSKYGELEHMFINENARGNGIGEKLIKEFKKWTKEKDLKRIKVNVSFKNQKAIEFYKKIGLVPTDIVLVGNVN
ncbi:GNAT family N-acetyltransferase [Patescibacteria group bacterium]|nr:GNAT family N-acetyltransferase [Patescibacteria group bacterium]